MLKTAVKVLNTHSTLYLPRTLSNIKNSMLKRKGNNIFKGKTTTTKHTNKNNGTYEATRN